MRYLTKELKYKGAVLHYAIYQGGPKTLLAFHGFDQSFSHFSQLANVLSKEYTVYSIDLFYHGGSIWPDSSKPVTKDFWKALMTEFFEIHRIDEFSLAGFSLGGKFVLATFNAFPERTRSILFIAPDGIRTSFWYSLATWPGWARKYFQRMIAKPEPFFKLLDTLKKHQVVDESVLRFAHYQMGSKHQREKVYNTWVMSRELKFNMAKTADLINRHNVRISMYLGRFDKLMTEKGMTSLLKHVKEYDLQVLETGHAMLIDKVARHIKTF